MAVSDAGRSLFARPCTFVTSATSLEGLPDPEVPEVAFAGRSNCGKSSLINALTGRRSLARTSRTPGRTRAINVFSLDGRMHLVDLPGYGYAVAGKAEIAGWTRAVDDYLVLRPVLRRVFLLLDARRGITDRDRVTFDSLDTAGVAWQAVLTKSDKVKGTGLDDVAVKVEKEIRQRSAAVQGILITSARKGRGIDDLRSAIAVFAS